MKPNPAQEARKKAAAEAALQFVTDDMVIGLGSGSTVHAFIDALPAVRQKIEAVVASSAETARRAAALSFKVTDLNTVGELPLYVDGADEIDTHLRMIKGGGGALTQEKIIASVARQFVCIADASKRVDMLGKFPVAVEVIPMARSAVARQIVLLGGQPVWREGFVTDNGNVILDVFNLRLLDPIQIEEQLNNIPGVVANGIFARRPADVLLLGTDQGVTRF